MNLAFFDAIDWDYDVATPYQRPLGGSQSAECFLAVCLAARGHAVTLYSGTTNPRTHLGVRCVSLAAVCPELLAPHDVVIVLGGPPHACNVLRPIVSPKCRLILWTMHAHDQPVLKALHEPQNRAGWDTIVCVSQWHLSHMQQHFHLDSNRVTILRNAFGPQFANLFADAHALAAAKSSEPALAYTSTPFRGLDVLLSIFPDIHRGNERTRLRVYSSMRVYYHEESGDQYANLYSACRSTGGVEYVGSLPQPMLAQSLKADSILSYPSTFAETSCIAVMEALAAGLLVVTTDLGALSETAMGLATLVPPPRDAQDRPAFVQAYRDALLAALLDLERDPTQFWSARWRQVRATATRCNWPLRAGEWEQFLLSQVIA